MIRFLLIIFLVLNSIKGFSQDSTKTANKKTKKDTTNQEVLPPALGDFFKPQIGLGAGMFSFYGDVYKKNYQAPWTSRLAYDLSISQPLNHYLRLNFYVLFGKLGANERIEDKRFVNFESQIRMGGLNVMYTFDHLFKDDLKIRPWVSLGVEGFEFLSKTDMYDRFGNKYFYWSDGSIKNMDENAAGAQQNAIELVRDYTYESDVRELNLDGFGKYQERSWAIPMGAGAIMKIGERFEFKMGATFHYAFTDYIDGVSNQSVADRVGNKRKDCFVMTSFSLHYDLVTKRKTDTLPNDYYNDVDFLALDKDDEDGDGVRDFDDLCHQTPAGVPVTKNGCPIDEDGDHIPDYRDDELPTTKGVIVNAKGVGYSDDMAQRWYDMYYDSTSSTAPVVVLGNFYKGEENGTKESLVKNGNQAKEFRVELGKFKGSVPDDVMLYLLSIGDVESTTSGDYKIYTAGKYTDVKTAQKRKEEFETLGIKDVKIGVYENGEYKTLNQQEVADETNKSNGVVNVNENKNPNAVIDPHATIFRVQLGAYKNPISKSVFGNNAGNIVEIQTDDGYYRYASGAYKTLNDAAIHRADIALDGYPDAFITAYKNKKRIPLKEAGATFENKKDEKEDVNQKANPVNTIDKSLVTYRVQLASVKKTVNSDFEDQTKTLKDIEKQNTVTGMVRYTAGKFSNYNDAVKLKNQLVQDGFSEAFVIAMFKNEIISIQEANELLK